MAQAQLDRATRRRLRHREREAEKLAGTYRDRRRREPWVDFSIPRDLEIHIRGYWNYYIHLVGDNTQVTDERYLLRCRCTRLSNGVRHGHALYAPQPREWRLIRTDKMYRNRGEYPKGRRFLIQCFDHFLNVVHYLRCPKSQKRTCIHDNFDDVTGYFPPCLGRCRDYRANLARIFDYKHPKTCPVPACARFAKRVATLNKYYLTC